MTSSSRRIGRAIFFVYLVLALGAAVMAVPIAGALEPTLLAQAGNASSGSSGKAAPKAAEEKKASRQASAGNSTPAIQPPAAISFEEVDRNKDGMLDKSEAAGVPGLSAYFERVDRNRDGKLGRDEFEQGLSVINLQK